MTDERCWIVTYEYEPKVHAPRPPSESGPSRRNNVALRGIHPAVWLSTPPDSFRTYYVQHLLFFQEIDLDTYQAIERASYISCEDHTTKATATVAG